MEQLAHAVEHNLLGHAYLFTGKDHKATENARELTMAVNCYSPVAGTPCGECLACQKIKHGNHPDVFEVEPQGTSLKIEQMREVQKAVAYKHFEGRYKVIILWRADLMTEQAGNSLLKILEEPPHKTLFILVAENGDNILPTVLSRCQVIRFGQGGHDSAIGLDISDDDRRQVVELVEAVSSIDDLQLLSVADSWQKTREESKKLLEGLALCFREIAVTKITGSNRLACKPIVFQDMSSSSLTPGKALQAAEAVQNSIRLLDQNANLKLIIDILFLQLKRMLG